MKLKKFLILILIMSLCIQTPICSVATDLSVNTDLSEVDGGELTNSLMEDEQTGNIAQDGGGAGNVLKEVAKYIAKFILNIINFCMGITNDNTGTIESMCYNDVPMFEIDFFSNINEQASNKDFSQLIKINVKKWYNAIRNIAIGGLLIVLVYIGIRMALSTTGSQQGKYKKMLNSWLTSFVLLFVLQYIMIAVIAISNQAIKLIEMAKTSYVDSQMENLLEQINSSEFELFENKGELVTKYKNLENFKKELEGSNFEEILLNKIYNEASSFVGTIMFCVLVFYIAKFFVMYLRRTLIVAFLIVISPLITITYAIDKAGDNKAQAFNTWLKEFVINIVIQPIHAILYTVFIFSALYISGQAPILAIIFFALLSRGERIARKVIFQKFSGGSVLGSLEKTLPVKRRC